MLAKDYCWGDREPQIEIKDATRLPRTASKHLAGKQQHISTQNTTKRPMSVLANKF